jgi:hypothetical protein
MRRYLDRFLLVATQFGLLAAIAGPIGLKW